MAIGTITKRGKRPPLASNPAVDCDDAREARRAARIARQEEQSDATPQVPKTADGSRSDTDGRHTCASRPA